MIVVATIAAKSELAIGFCEKILVTQGTLRAENPIIRASAKGEIVPVDYVLRLAPNFHLMIFELKRTKIGELLGDGRVESGHGIFLLRHRFQLRRVAAAEIARARGQRKTRQCDNEEPTQHRICSTQGGRSRQLAGVAASL